MLEKLVENRLKKKVELKGGECLKIVSPGRKGIPDRLVITPDGRVFFVELKTDEGVLSPIQKNCIKRLNSLKQNCAVIWNTQQVDDFIHEVFDEV